MVSRILRRAVSELNLRLRGSERVTLAVMPSSTDVLEGIEEDLEDVREGNPRSKTQWIARASDGGVATGIWECTAGTFGWHFSCDEVVHILDGEATVQHDGKTLELRAGTVAFFPLGARTV